MNYLDRYTVTSLWLADFLSDPVRRIILAVSKCDHLVQADNLLNQFIVAITAETKHILHPSETSFKRFYWQVFGDLAADVIRTNLETGQESIA